MSSCHQLHIQHVVSCLKSQQDVTISHSLIQLALQDMVRTALPTDLNGNVTVPAKEINQQAGSHARSSDLPLGNLLINSLAQAAPEAAAAAATALQHLQELEQIQQAAEAEEPLDSLLGAMLSPAATDTASSDGNSSDAIQDQQSKPIEEQTFEARYHWKTGDPLEAAIWTQTEETAILLTKYQTPEELLGCPVLKRYLKRRIETAVKQCNDRALVANRNEAAKGLAAACQEAIAWLREWKPRQEALSSRALHLYASSLSNNRFINGSAAPAAANAARPARPAASRQMPANGGRRSAAAQRGGADLIREQNIQRQAAKQQVKLAVLWMHWHFEVYLCLSPTRRRNMLQQTTY